MAEALKTFPLSPLAYADFTLSEADPWRDGGSLVPAFDYERMLEAGLRRLVFAARPDYVRAATRAGASDLFRLFFFSQDRRRAPSALGSRSESC